jgi:hypothetical protein
LEAHAAVRQSAGAFFEELRGTWAQAALAAGSIEIRRYRVAGNQLELRFAGDALVEPLARGLEHLDRGDDNARGLVVRLWDRESTGVSMPRPPWDMQAYGSRGKIDGFFDERIQSVFQHGSQSLVMVDLERSEALYWTASPEQVPPFEMAAPLQTALQPWLGEHGAELIHAAAVATDVGCGLLVGKAGSGKSWTTLASMEAGLKLVSDDYCVLAAGMPPRISSLYNGAKAFPGALERLPAFAGMVSNPVRQSYDKAVLFIHEHAPEAMLLESDLRAILIPRVAGQPRTTWRPASSAAALAALAPSTILQLPGAGARTLERLAEVAREVPSFRVDLGTDLDEVGQAIATLLG